MKSIFIKNLIVFNCLGWVFAAGSLASGGVGKVVSLTGKVMARIEGGDPGRRGGAKMRQLKPGDDIFREDVINTASDASVKLMFNDQSIMDLGQSSLFKVEQYEPAGRPEERKVAMSLSYGRIRAAINQKIGNQGSFKIKTKAATMGVRGTEFYVLSDIASSMAGKESRTDPEVKAPAKTQVVVTEGKVEVEKPKISATAPVEKPMAVLPGEKFTATVELPKMDPKEDRKIASVAATVATSVEKVSVAEMKSVVNEVKLKDTTFAQAIQIDPAPASGGKGEAGPAGVGGGLGGAETLAAIKDSILSKPELTQPATGANFAVPGVPMTQPGFNGNFLPGFNGRLVKLHVIFEN
jgi:hypothetical protein